MQFNVSVIIPLYNAAEFIEKAIYSALNQDETSEVIVVDDASTDDSLDICRRIESIEEKVKVLQNHENSGVSFSLNRGLEMAKYPFIGILGADDYYLENSFQIISQIFKSNPGIDGVFGTIGAHFYTEEAKKKHMDRTGKENTGLSIEYNPNDGNLFSILLLKGLGHLSLCGMIFKTSALTEIGVFDVNLIQSQDTDIIWRFALKKKLIGLNPSVLIAKRGVHERNRVTDQKQHEFFTFKLYCKWVNYIIEYKLGQKESKKLFLSYLRFQPNIRRFNKKVHIRFLLKTYYACIRVLRNPGLIYFLSRFNKM